MRQVLTVDNQSLFKHGKSSVKVNANMIFKSENYE